MNTGNLNSYSPILTFFLTRKDYLFMTENL